VLFASTGLYPELSFSKKKRLVIKKKKPLCMEYIADSVALGYVFLGALHVFHDSIIP
jgi:hypothetical protein